MWSPAVASARRHFSYANFESSNAASFRYTHEVPPTNVGIPNAHRLFQFMLAKERRDVLTSFPIKGRTRWHSAKSRDDHFQIRIFCWSAESWHFWRSWVLQRSVFMREVFRPSSAIHLQV